MRFTDAQRRAIEIVALADNSDPFAAARTAKDIRKDKRIFLEKDETFDGRPRLNDPDENLKAMTNSALVRFNERQATIRTDAEAALEAYGPALKTFKEELKAT